MDVFVEQVVTRKRRGMYEALFYVCWVLLVLCALAGLSGLMNILYTSADGGLGFRPLAIGMAVVFLGAAFLLWRASMRLRTEYDYSFTNGVLDVARVMNGRKRVYLTSFDVKDLRAAAGLSQERFALKIGMDRTYLASIEVGGRNVTLQNLAKIANGFDMTLSEFFEGIPRIDPRE